MAAPTVYAVTILINGVDVSSYIPYKDMRIEDNYRDVGYFRFVCEEPSGVTPEKNHTVVVTANNLSGTPQVFNGFITEIKDKKRDNGIKKQYEITASDRKVLLQKSIMESDEFTGTDAEILALLLGNAYPDLSGYFDFQSGVNGFTGDLSLNLGNKTLLESLSDLADLTGANWWMDNATGGTTTITFDDAVDTVDFVNKTFGSITNGDKPCHAIETNVGWSPAASIAVSGGNDGDCFDFSPTSGSGGGNLAQSRTYISVFGDTEYTLNGVSFDYYIDSSIVADIEIRFLARSALQSTISGLTGDAWTTVSVAVDGDTNPFPLTRASAAANAYDFGIQFWATSSIDATVDTVDIRLDNIVINADPSIEADTAALQWDATAPAADFNFDIQSGNEFGSDFFLDIGDPSDFNSVTVVGGYEDFAIDWTYHNNNFEERINLEEPVKDIAVFSNSGTDGTPSWTELDVGIWGTDFLTSQGGSKDVLYAKDTAWLLFNTAPPDLEKSVRVTGSIRRPWRVRVEDVADGDPTFVEIIRDENITSEDDAVAIAQTKLAQQNATRRLEFKTYEPGLKAGQSINVADSARGLDETLVITQIITEWNGNIGVFSVVCGEDDYMPVDRIISMNERRSRQNGLPPITSTTSITFLTDTDGTYLTDANGRRLYYTS